MTTTVHRRGRRADRLTAAQVARYRAVLDATNDLDTIRVGNTRARDYRATRRLVRTVLRTGHLIGDPA